MVRANQFFVSQTADDLTEIVYKIHVLSWVLVVEFGDLCDRQTQCLPDACILL
jgi:hypothetical protein